ncbi:unnamed protein product, partial [Brenthis ino]
MASDGVISPARGDGVSRVNSTTSVPMFPAIEKLEGSKNYLAWKFAIRMVLILEGLWDCVTANVVTDAARDQRALARIALSVKTSLYQHIRNAATAKEAWDSLSDIFEDKGLLRRVLLLRELHRTRYTDFNDMSKYIDNTFNIVQQLADIGRKIEDEEIAELLLSGLPQEYDSLVSNLSTFTLTTRISSEVVRTRLLQEDLRRNNSNSHNISEAAYISKRKVKCDYCHKENHVKAKCFKLKRDKKLKNSTNVCMAAAYLSRHRQEDWL